jgi:hypothetical protein
MEIGSLAWRIRNYGVLPAMIYVLDKFRRPYKSNLAFSDIVETLTLLGVENSNEVVCEIRELINLEFTKLNYEFSKSNKFKLGEIKEVITPQSTITRLVIICSIIKCLSCKIIIETGSQHGASAHIIRKAINIYNPSIVFKSFDVKRDILVSDEFADDLISVLPPVRKTFKKLTNKLKGEGLLFFHDSDHSRENMNFEIDWAWNFLKCEYLVSDDIDGNSAFEKFCNRNSLIGKRIKFDNGPSVGLVVRN